MATAVAQTDEVAAADAQAGEVAQKDAFYCNRGSWYMA